ncbi:MAG: VanZ family protein [Candidatus Limivicinus sp.]|jgi:VanZ family protein
MSKHKFKIILYSALTFSVICAIYFFSAQDSDLSQETSDGFLAVFSKLFEKLPRLSNKGVSYDVRKYAHMTEFFGLACSCSLLSFEIFRYKKFRFLLSPLLSFLFSFLIASGDELHQFFVPGRSAEFRDVLIDSVGIFLGTVFILVIHLIIFTAKKGRQSNG